jgi:phosphoribosyl-ATP pyrophosphohydrolase
VLYHLLVMLAARDVTLGDVERREGASGLQENLSDTIPWLDAELER